ncbi:phage tail tape measure protein [Thermoactinomyces sp. DSM 45892]|uniref:phage tail tape measure protein n=1 Tax=Thermoactinomyces sp. DSM 45892 TaxID=1882753 RepID=UPI00089534B0|nr:phage tail tape measure protein [Thermoactinomyces sp. DSM 45892]SDZ05286.1 phage tail tape measure protein, TP901 family, core region [Thermoactinomyces sp. DSM 45892]
MSGFNAGTVRARLILENSQFRRGMMQARQDMSGLSRDAMNVRKSGHMVQESMLAVGAGIIGIVGASVVVAARFEQEMARVKAISGATEEEFASLTAEAQRLGATTSFSASQAAQGMSLLASAGFKTNEIIGTMPALLNLAGASQLDLATSADYLTSIMSGFGFTAKDSGKAVDVLVQAMNDANTELPDLAEAMKYVGPVASSVKMDFEDVAAAIALLSNNGIKGSMAGTAMRMALIRLASPTREVKKVMAELGLQFTDAQGKMKPLPEIIDHLNDRMKHLTDSQKLDKIATIFGTESATAITSLMKAGGKAIDDFSNRLENANGAAAAFSKTVKDTTVGAWDQFLSALEAVGIKLGTQFLPEIRRLLSAGTDLLNWIGELNPAMIEFGLKVAAGAVALTTLASAFRLVGTGVRAMQLAMGPQGWLLLGLGALAGAVWGASDAMEEAAKVDLSRVESLQKVADTTKEQVDRFDALREKNKLSNDEMLRFLDIQTQLKAETDPQVIKAFQEEMDGLRKKSGLTNEEFNELIKLNSDLLSKIPSTETAVSSLGNQWAKTTDEMRRYNAEQREAVRQELQVQKDKADAKSSSLARELGESVAKMKELNQQADTWRQKRTQAIEDIKTKEAELADARQRGNQLEITALENQLQAQRLVLENANQQLAKSSEQREEEKKKADELWKQVTAAQTLYEKMIALEMAEVGISYKRGEGTKQIDEAISKTQSLLSETIRLADADGVRNDKEREAISLLQSQLEKQEAARQKVRDLIASQADLRQALAAAGVSAEDLNRILGKPTSKSVTVDPGGTGKQTADALHMNASKQATKPVDITDPRYTLQKIISDIRKGETKPVTAQVENRKSFLADLTSRVTKFVSVVWSWVGGSPDSKRHSGGTVHELPKFHSGGSPNFSITSAPKFDEVDVRILRNEMVLTQAQQANLFRMIQTFSYAKADQFKETRNPTTESVRSVVIQIGSMVVREEADIKKISEELDRLARQKSRSRGEY